MVGLGMATAAAGGGREGFPALGFDVDRKISIS
jgi:hypothetical protein